MRVSLSWLREFVDLDVPVEKLVELLDMSGTKVESTHRPTHVEGVVVSEVLDVRDHPDADHLVVVEVSTGESRERVVCGVRNFSVGDRVPLARVGARLGEITVSEREIRGQPSRGMLCSPFELGISTDHSGILVLPADAELGSDVASLLGLDDTVLELEITPNRPDCMSVLGVAREVAALLGNELKVPTTELVTTDDVVSPVSVRIEDPRGCPRFVARYIADVKIAPSPAWMARRLVTGGIRPVSNVVDATNYVMLELGHPLHAFDAARIHKQRIVVRRAQAGERFTTLDGVERRLHSDDLVVADPRKALGIAGVMGGEHSEVSDETSDVILECAYWDPDSIAFTSRRHLLRTEASARFERGADPEAPPAAAARCAQLIAELAGGQISTAFVDEYVAPVERRVIHLRPSRTVSLLGLDLSASSQANHLSSIGLEVADADDGLTVTVPTFRPDLAREIDLIEEVARLAGYERLPSTVPPGRAGGLDRDQAAERTLRRALAAFGLFEAWTPSFSSEGELDALGLPSGHPARLMIALENPISEEQTTLRTTLLPGLLRSVARNVAHHVEGVALFEIARIYEPTEDGRMPTEALVLGAAFAGPRHQKGWRWPETTWDFFAAKGVLESTLGSLRLPDPSFDTVEGPPFHPTRAARVSVAGTHLGVLGELHPDVCERFDAPEGTVAFEISFAPVLAHLPGRVSVEELPRFPAVYIDVAVIVDDHVPAARVQEVVGRAGGPEVITVRLFDLYSGEQVSGGRKSLAFALELRHPERTLTDEDASAVRARIVDALSKELGAELRG
jgi:phenylalanyl-tRNA synthetase beta chain